MSKSSANAYLLLRIGELGIRKCTPLLQEQKSVSHLELWMEEVRGCRKFKASTAQQKSMLSGRARGSEIPRIIDDHGKDWTELLA